jgi:hypothetical protein
VQTASGLLAFYEDLEKPLVIKIEKYNELNLPLFAINQATNERILIDSEFKKIEPGRYKFSSIEIKDTILDIPYSVFEDTIKFELITIINSLPNTTIRSNFNINKFIRKIDKYNLELQSPTSYKFISKYIGTAKNTEVLNLEYILDSTMINNNLFDFNCTIDSFVSINYYKIKNDLYFISSEIENSINTVNDITYNQLNKASYLIYRNFYSKDYIKGSLLIAYNPIFRPNKFEWNISEPINDSELIYFYSNPSGKLNQINGFFKYNYINKYISEINSEYYNEEKKYYYTYTSKYDKNYLYETNEVLEGYIKCDSLNRYLIANYKYNYYNFKSEQNDLDSFGLVFSKGFPVYDSLFSSYLSTQPEDIQKLESIELKKDDQAINTKKFTKKYWILELIALITDLFTY